MTSADPLLRLADSRARIRLVLQQWQSGQEPAGSGAAPAWLNGLRAEPGTGALLDALKLWWAQQPWRQGACVLAAAARQLLRPAAQHHPLLLVLVAAFAGGALVLLKPWRCLSLSTVAAGLLPQLLALLRPLSWIDLLTDWLQRATDKPAA